MKSIIGVVAFLLGFAVVSGLEDGQPLTWLNGALFLGSLGVIFWFVILPQIRKEEREEREASRRHVNNPRRFNG
jgi:protein-S-isoprenylcysteine O-methyltransferase Ste14